MSLPGVLMRVQARKTDQSPHKYNVMTMIQANVVSRRAILAGLGFAVVGAVTAATPRPPGRAFYVAANGDDRADGLTPATAWASIQKVNDALPEDSSVFFKCGDTFYGELVLPLGGRVSAFGSGPRPTLTALKSLNNADAWKPSTAGTWSIDLSSADTHTGYATVADANIGYLRIDGVIKADKKAHLSDLKEPWDFYGDTARNTLHVFSKANPSELADSIQAAPRGTEGAIISCNRGNNSITGVHITGTGAHGILGAGDDVDIQDCLIDYVGGSFLPNYRDGTARYGNGIENGTGARRWTITANEIAETYDVAYTCQGRAGPAANSWQDMTIAGNYIRNCTQSFEFWSMGRETPPHAGFQGISISQNHCTNAGYSVFSEVRPNHSNRVHILTYEWELPADIVIEDNVFSNAYTAYTYHLSPPVGLVSRKNTIILQPGTKMQYQRSETIEQAAEWTESTGFEQASTFVV